MMSEGQECPSLIIRSGQECPFHDSSRPSKSSTAGRMHHGPNGPPKGTIPGMSLFIESLNWREVGDALGEIKTILIPLGARCKEHGLHLPLNTDWIIAEYLAHRVAAMAEVLVVP